MWRRNTHQLNRQSTASRDSNGKTGKAADGSLLHYLRVLAFRLEGFLRLPIDSPNVDVVEGDLFTIMGWTISTVMNIILKAICMSPNYLYLFSAKILTQSLVISDWPMVKLTPSGKSVGKSYTPQYWRYSF
jgi:hypothetical protein